MLEKILTPKYCLVCWKKVDLYICPQCLKKLNFGIGLYCFECEKRIIEKCNISSHSRLIKGLICFGKYEEEKLKELVITGKEEAFEILNDFGVYISQQLLNFDFKNLKNFTLVPIPLTRKKLLKRTFNQAEVLAKKISQKTGLNFSNCLIKIKETLDQASLSYEERKRNLKNVFKVINKPPEKVILVDDIKTTGTTLKEAAKTLKEAGTKEIYALTILK